VPWFVLLKHCVSVQHRIAVEAAGARPVESASHEADTKEPRLGHPSVDTCESPTRAATSYTSAAVGPPHVCVPSPAHGEVHVVASPPAPGGVKRQRHVSPFVTANHGNVDGCAPQKSAHCDTVICAPSVVDTSPAVAPS